MASVINTSEGESGGHRIGKYRLLEQVGEGGMAVVYRAHDEILDRIVALKVLHSHLSGRADVRQRFAREARTVARLKHPVIVEVYDASTEAQNDCYIATEFVDGATLREFYIRNKPKIPETAVMIIARLASALSHAHEAGIIHRDIKPENVMVSRGGELKLMDFGIARVLDGDASLTMTGALMGSPAYMPPEHLEGHNIDMTGDVYSLGVMLYELVCGELPFKGETPAQLLRSSLDSQFVQPIKISPAVDSELNEIILQAMAREPTERFASVQEFKEALDDWLVLSGLEEYDVTVREYLANPQGNERKLVETISQSLLQEADKLNKKKEAQLGFELLNRVIELDPQNELAATKIKKILAAQKKASTYKYISYTAIGVVIVTAISFLFFERRIVEPITVEKPDNGIETGLLEGSNADGKMGVNEGQSENSAEDKSVNDAPLAENVPPIVIEKVTQPPQTGRPEAKTRNANVEPSSPTESAKNNEAKAREEAIFTGPPRETKFLLNTWVTVQVDDEIPLDLKRQSFVLSLSPGKHKVTFQNPNYLPLVTDVVIQPDGETQVFTFKLRPAPAYLTIRNSQNADIMLEGNFARNADDTVAHPLLVEIPQGTVHRNVKIKLIKAGFVPAEQEVSVSAGEKKEIQIELKPLGNAP